MAYRRNILPFDAYSVPGIVWHVVLATHNRTPAFERPTMAQVVVDSLRFETSRRSANLLVYCIMPDHVHAVLTSGDANLHDMIRRIKSFTTRQFQNAGGEFRLWQPSHFDHAIRVSEQMDTLTAYVINNPVRKGLAEDWNEWKWTGGTLIEERP